MGSRAGDATGSASGASSSRASAARGTRSVRPSDLAFDRLHQFDVLRVYRVADLEAAGFELVPTFRTPHVTVAWATDLDEGLGRFASARHQRRGNPYHERDRPEDGLVHVRPVRGTVEANRHLLDTAPTGP